MLCRRALLKEKQSRLEGEKKREAVALLTETQMRVLMAPAVPMSKGAGRNEGGAPKVDFLALLDNDEEDSAEDKDEDTEENESKENSKNE